ncbi:MAG: WYL domain-containing protein, partial [Anaerolineae bacterium]|nr:WYL domain-containing protein [Anaerolineae bacterium]
PNYLRILEVLTRCWSEGRRVHIWHKSERTGKVIEYIFAPYFIEPYAVGQTTHVIGLGRSLDRMSPDRMWTFKIERIERAEPLDETYTIPADFDPQEQLADAWGIWYTDDEPVEVVLKFHPRVAGRVKETRWHHSEDIKELPDGYLRWQAKIAQPKEMLNWVRGWGADVEVVEPEWLREMLMGEARRLAEMYGWSTTKSGHPAGESSPLSQTFSDFFGD